VPKKKPFEQLLRPAYEAQAAMGWAAAAVWMAAGGIVLAAGRSAMWAGALVAAVMGARRAIAGARLLQYKAALIGKPVELMELDRLRRSMPLLKDNLWLGWGFDWQPTHTARAYEILKRDKDEIYPPKWWLRWKGQPDPRAAKGLPWIHGIGMAAGSREQDILVPFDALKGHCAVVATTGAIKTRLAGLLIFQLAMRGDCVIVIDPKGDRELREICRQAAAAAGHPERFVMLHPAFASESVRLDLVKNWDRVSQVASRITMVLDSQETDNFKEFCWMAVHRVTSALKYLGRRVTIFELKRAMEDRSTVERLAEDALRSFFANAPQAIRENLERQTAAQNAKGGTKGARPGAIEVASNELAAMITVYNALPDESVQAATPIALAKTEEVSGLVAILASNRQWFDKMVVSITPMLTKLTTDDLRGLLSPDYDDINDPRPILDGRKIVDGKHLLYIGTDTLADESVGRAISTMALAELSSVAAEIYNHGTKDDRGDPRRVHVFVDEWGDAVCAPLIQQANKGRGAGFFIWALGQTFSDLVDKFGGNVARAKRFLGNMNNLIVGATKDPDTVKMVAEMLGETAISVTSETVGTGSKTEDVGLEFSAKDGKSISDKDIPIFNQALLPQMPDLHYIALLNRGRLVKGRIPVLVAESFD
jgi:conjugal transfer pilus assembly protein TraD